MKSFNIIFLKIQQNFKIYEEFTKFFHFYKNSKMFFISLLEIHFFVLL